MFKRCFTYASNTVLQSYVFLYFVISRSSSFDNLSKEKHIKYLFKKEMSEAIALLVTANDRLQAIIAHTEELRQMTDVSSFLVYSKRDDFKTCGSGW